MVGVPLAEHLPDNKIDVERSCSLRLGQHSLGWVLVKLEQIIRPNGMRRRCLSTDPALKGLLFHEKGSC